MSQSIYRLVIAGKPDRVELLTEKRVKVRNLERKREGKAGEWTVDATATEADITRKDAPELSADEKAARKAKAAEADKKHASTKKHGSAPKETIAISRDRQEWKGFSMVSIIRWAGAHKYGKPAVLAIAKHCGFKPGTSTVYRQLLEGRQKLNLPVLSEAQSAELKKAALKVVASK